MEYGGGGGSGSGGDHDASDPSRRKKRYHRHTANQIQRLEAMFKECPHPDEKQRLQLSRELGLAPRQIKFWFQNRRTQMKAQHERADNCALRSENDKIRCENIAIREALKNVICPSCGGPPLDRVSSIAAKYIGRPISQLPPVQPIHISSLDLTMASFGGVAAPSLDLDLLPGSSSAIPNLPFQPIVVSDMDKSLMTDIATNALEELLRLLQTNEPLWIKSSTDGRDVLSLETYERIFSRPNTHFKSPNLRIEASRDSGVVIMNGLALSKWVELFPTIVSMAKTIEVISSGMMGSHSGSLQLMYEELQVLSPLVSTREFYILRYCQQIEQGLWAIVNVSYEFPQFASQVRSHRLPSGCLIQDMPNGYSKSLKFVTCSRALNEFPNVSVIPSPDGKRSMMKLAQRMVNNFCTSISTSNSHRWTTLSGVNEVGVRVTVHKSCDPGQPNGVVLSAATTFWLPVTPQNVFNFFKDERTRPQWDVLSNGNAVQEVAHIANGSHPGNCISVLRAFNTSQNNMLILQESCIDSSGSLVVYCPVDLPAVNVAMSGEDPSYIPLLPSGFTISPDGHPEQGDGASTSSSSHGNMGRCGGSLITVAFQILVSSLPSAKLNMESVTTVNNLIGTTVQQIKTALNCPGS
ncbi:hypothetical protein COLO4_04639 [Corchorus olitorius]|uniref:Homeobox domain-containing protein n=1 Tax=Corchorus olitorius TaxID=93759 RepID=A0A1R3KT60_9ROSI|nr:hypothetical protein COLO4_04639 [Corchorus olitorius]